MTVQHLAGTRGTAWREADRTVAGWMLSAVGQVVSPMTRGRMLVAALITVTSALIIVPIGVLGIGSFLSDPPRALHFDWSGLTLHNYVEIFANPGFAAMLGRTLGASLVGTMGA